MNYRDVMQLDRTDPLAGKRGEFVLPQDRIYLDGNSLGAMPVAAKQRAAKVMDRQWGQDLIGSWNSHDWIGLPTTVGEKIAPLLGAAPGQVICCDSTSVNLFKLLCTALGMQKDRRLVISQTDNFPADLYMAQGLSNLARENLCELQVCEDTEIEARLDETVAVLMLTHVNFRTGKLHDMQILTRAAHDKGILVIWDLAHSTGALPLSLDECMVDFAVGCGYKYLNGGPGAPAFIYAAKRHHASIRQPLSGWMGHASPFEFAQDYQPAEGVQQFLCGTPPVLSMSVLEAALSVFENVDMRVVWEKSIGLSELFLQLASDHDALDGLKLISPVKSHDRGSQLAFAHPHAYEICQALIDRGVTTDFRAPDVLRLGFSPLYLGYRDIWRAVHILAEIMAGETWREDRYAEKRTVT